LIILPTEKAKACSNTHQAVEAVWIGLEGACYVLNGKWGMACICQ